MAVILAVLVSYLAGSFPTSILITRWVTGRDIRQMGSGNAGGTNVARSIGFRFGIIVMLVDFLKGFIAANLIYKISYLSLPLPLSVEPTVLLQLLCAAAATIGHIWTVFAGFKGGKGVATAIGSIIGLFVLPAIAALAVFAIVLVATRYVSAGSVLGALAFPIAALIQQALLHFPEKAFPQEFVLLCVIVGLLVFTHRANIRRIFSGTERKIGKKKIQTDVH